MTIQLVVDASSVAEALRNGDPRLVRAIGLGALADADVAFLPSGVADVDQTLQRLGVQSGCGSSQHQFLLPPMLRIFADRCLTKGADPSAQPASASTQHERPALGRDALHAARVSRDMS